MDIQMHLRVPSQTAKMPLVIWNQLPSKQNGVLAEDHEMKKVVHQQDGPLLDLRHGLLAPLQKLFQCALTLLQKVFQ